MQVVQAFLSLSTAFGLSTSAGLNAYIPLLTIALVDRLSDGLVDLQGPWVWLSSWWTIGVLAVLLTVEILVDKVPAADTVNDIIQTVVRPAAGAILFAASTHAIGLHPVLAAICGVILAGGVHTVKAGGRPVLTATTAGTANPIISTIEDVIAAVGSFIAVLYPYLVLVFILLLILLILLLMVWRRRRREAATRGSTERS
ncbi:MAG TPA: DUF4126 domain-containing protein [Anaerolineales bacterium]|nr:DUF4126 domain-containing protein [Anaerolineae bacterium]HIQ00807.1 DUF4126 domain-containing protein [Anaerolineales bacterium]